MMIKKQSSSSVALTSRSARARSRHFRVFSATMRSSMCGGSGFESALVLSGPISLQAGKLGFFQGLGQVTLLEASFSLSWRQVHRHSFGSWDTGVVLPSYISKTGVIPVEAS